MVRPLFIMAACPACDTEIDVDDFDVDRGDQLSCPECGSNLEVMGLSPVQLELASEEEEQDEETCDATADKDDTDDEWDE